MKKIIPLFFMTLLCFTFVSAEITIDNIKKSYSIGEDISPIIKFTIDSTSQYLFSAKISCDGYSLKYFVQPLELKENKEKKIEVPILKASEDMLGTCTINFYLDSIKGSEIEAVQTEEFDITPEQFAPESVEDVMETSINETQIDESKKNLLDPSKENGLLYFFLFIIAITILVLYIKIRKNYNNKRFNINKGWKLHKRRF
jgi:hypothetical protein